MGKQSKWWQRAAAWILSVLLLAAPGLALADGLTWDEILGRYPGKEVELLTGSLDATYWRSWQEAEQELAEQFLTMELFRADGSFLPLGETPVRLATGQYGCFYHSDYPDGARLFSVVIKGDVMGTGLLNISQLVRMAEDLTDRRKLTGLYELAGDINGNGEVDIVDLAYLGLWLRTSMTEGPPAPRAGEPILTWEAWPEQ